MNKLLFILQSLAFVPFAAAYCESCNDWCISTHSATEALINRCIISDCLCVCDNGELGKNGEKCGTIGEIDNFFACFSSHSTADVKGKGKVTMDQLQVGDEVLASNGEYEVIYAIDHRHPTKATDFIQIHASTQQEPLELTAKHMLFLEGNPNPVPADTVKVGDAVQTLQGPSEVTKIDKITRAGLFSPLTNDGTIVVSGIIASSYSAHLSDDEWIEIAGVKVMTHQSFFDMALRPYRYMCTGISLDLCKTNNEKVAIGEFAAKLYNHSAGQSELYFSFMLGLVILCVCAFDFVLSPYGLGLALFWTTYLVARKQLKHKTM